MNYIILSLFIIMIISAGSYRSKISNYNNLLLENLSIFEIIDKFSNNNINKKATGYTSKRKSTLQDSP